MGRKLTTKEFITRAKDVHGDKYDYSLVKYVNARTKVKIICSEHGVFEQTPDNHLHGHGCLMCKVEQQRFTTTKFITRAREIHGDRYDYSLVEYVNYNSLVKLICPEHGVFEQTPNIHLQGKGCPQCVRVNNDIFIIRSREIHGDKYDYSLVEYVGNQIKVNIICPEHGVFEQIPTNHWYGRGCPQCAKTGFNPLEPGTLYVLVDDKQCPTLIKIGVTNNLKQRLRQLQRRTPHPVVKLVSYPFPHGADAYKLEQDVHKVYHELNARLKGFDGATEWFIFSPAILDYIQNNS